LKDKNPLYNDTKIIILSQSKTEFMDKKPLACVEPVSEKITS